MVGLLVAAALFSGVVQDGRVLPADRVEVASAEARPLHGPADFSGDWIYNESESINVATGRPETARAADQRRGAGRGPAPQTGPLGPTSSSIVQEGAFNLYQARRDTRRDLLEIAPRLSLAASAELLTITDDLERELSFPANGLRRKYQLGAAVFEATGAWDRDRFVVEIEGPDDLQIFQTWFLSQDGSRLFLVIRVGEAVRGARPVGVNRVYDRVRRDLSPATRD